MTSQMEGGNKVFRVEYNSTVGRHLVANRVIEAGETIIDEEALVRGPVDFASEGNQFFNHLEINPSSICCVCFQSYLNPKCLIQCDNCQCTAFCSSHCVRDKLHKENECRILNKFKEIRTIVESLSLSEFNNLVTTIRLLFLRFRHSVSWKQILNLQSKVKELNELGIFRVSDQIFKKLSWDDFEFKEDGLDCSKINLMDAARHCLGVLRINAYSLVQNSMRFQGLYFFTALLSHSCIMNTDRQIDLDREGRMIVKAAVKINQGEAITTTYLSLMNNTRERQAEMMSSWLFTCSCPRCQDEFEMGTFLSTVIFSGSEFDLPSMELIVDKNCTREPMSEVVARIKLSIPKNIENIECVEGWLEKFDNGKYLHKNHSVVSQVKLYLSHAYGRQQGGMEGLTDQQLFRKHQLCLEILQIYNILYAGLYQCRGELLFELWTTLREMRQRNLVHNDDLYKNTEEKVVKEAHQILSHAPKTSSHAQMNEILMEECSNILINGD